MSGHPQKLYILGNGFDLHHDLHTSYGHFREEYAKKHVGTIWKQLRVLYGDQIEEDIWWSQFEKMLGKVNYSSLLRSNNGEPLGSVKVHQFLKNTLPPLFGEWIMNVNKSIDADSITKISNMDSNALFFTFNYTTILEKVYHVTPSHIWYIHNSVAMQDVYPIVGHDSSFKQISDYSNPYREQGIAANILDDINREVINGAKNVKERIEKNIARFKEQYEDVNCIIAMGFSFNDIDMPYIEKIIGVNSSISSVRWTIYWHSENDDIITKQKLIKLGVPEDNIDMIYW